MAYSIQRDVSNGSLQYLEVRIEYFAKEHLSAFIAEKLVPQGTTPDPISGYCWTWDGNRIKFNKAVANGLEVMVRRATPIAVPFHIFRQGAVFKDLTVDENFLQQLYINQENQEGQTTTDFYSDLNFHGYRLRNVGAAIHDYDAVPFSQYRADALGAMQQRILAEQAKDTAVSAKDTTVAAKTATEVARDAALVSQNAAKTSETNAKASEVAASASANSAANSATASANSAAAAKADADRAKASADSIDPVVLNQKIDGAINKNTTQDMDIANLKVDVKKAQRPMFSVEWWGGRRTAIPAGAVPADGQVLSASVYPDAYNNMLGGGGSVLTHWEDDWLANPAYRGHYAYPRSLNGTFRVPDYNGKMADSLGAVFLRGDGKNSHASGVGYIQRDAIQDHQHTNGNTRWTGSQGAGGGAANGFPNDPTGPITGGARVALETRPINATGCWIIWLFGSVTNAGSADAAALATAYAGLAGRMSTIESRVSGVDTVYIKSSNYTDPYPPTDLTISANEIPSTIGVNTRIIVPNPFGGNESCIAQAELFMGGGWFNTGFVNISGSGGAGVTASYVPGIGVVIQSGSAALHTVNSYDSGGSYGTVGGSSGLPVRVKLTRVKGKQ